jgi:hypothetical protein
LGTDLPKRVPKNSVSSDKPTALVKGPGEVKLQFVSPVEETADQAASELNSGGDIFHKQKSEIRHLELVKSKTEKRQKKQHSGGGKSQRKRKFSYKALNDIFSKSR